MLFQLRHTYICLLVFLTAAAHAATLNVGIGQPYITIQSAINAANAGDTVLVAPGIYNENIDFHGKAITVTSSTGPAATIIDGGAKYGVGTVNFQSGELRTSVISNFTIRNGGGLTGYYAAGGGVSVSGAAPTIQGNIITGNLCHNVNAEFAAALITDNEITAPVAATSGYPCSVSGIFIESNGSVGGYYHTDVVANTIENNIGDAVGGIEMNAATGSVIQSNIIRNNRGGDAGGIYVYNTDNFSIIQNLVYGNSAYGFVRPISGPGTPSGVDLLAPYSTVGPFTEIIAGNTITDSLLIAGNLAQFLVINNILANSSSSTPALQCPTNMTLAITPASIDHNDIYNSAGQAYSSVCPIQLGAYGNISADPLFLAPSNGNYQLGPHSPAMDLGNNSSPFIPATDLAGSARITDATGLSYPAIDMGAYESVGTPDLGHTVVGLTPSEYFTAPSPTPAPPPLTFSVSLASAAAGQPTGYVAIYEDSTLLGTVSVTSAAPVTFSPTNLAAGTHSFTAVYPAPQTGAANPPFYDTPAVSPRFYLLVPNTLTSLTLSSTLNPSSYFGPPINFLVRTSSSNGNYPSPVTLTDTSTQTLLGTQNTDTTGATTFYSVSLTPGTHVITAAFAGSATQNAASATVTQIVNPIPSSPTLILLNPTSGAAGLGAPVLLSAGVGPIVGGIGYPTGTVTFFDGSSPLGSAPLVNTRANLTTSSLSLGSHTLTCLYSGDTNFTASPCNTVPLNVGPQPQTITFPALATPAYDATSVTLTASSTSGLPITYTVLSGPASVTGTTLTYTGLGTITLQAAQAGNAAYAAAPPVTATVTTQLLTQTLTTRSAPVPTVMLFTSTGTLASIATTTQGAPSLDFALAPGGTCTLGNVYTAGQTCTAYFTFAPTHPGPRFGGIAFSDAQGNLLANSYLLGSGTGPQLFYLPPTQSFVGSGFGHASGAAIDGFGNVFISDQATGIYEIALATGATHLVAPLPHADDVIVDGSGNVFAIGESNVIEILAVNGTLPANPTVRTLATGFYELDGVKVDSNGNVFVADGGNHTPAHPGAISELLAVNGTIPPNPTIVNIGSGFGILTGVAVDTNGNVFASDQAKHAVFEVQAVNGVIPANPTIISVGSGFITPANVAFDGVGDLFVPDVGTHSIREVLAVKGVIPANPTIVDLGSNINTPNGLVVDPSGNVFIADSAYTQAVELNYGTPPTLTFASTTVNTTSADSPKSFTITNAGNADLSLLPPATGSNPAITPGFSLDPASTCPIVNAGSSPSALHPTQSCTTAVDFTPIVIGPATGTVIFASNNLSISGTQTVKLIGNGLAIAPTLTFAVSNHTFGDPPFPVAATSSSPAVITYSFVSGPATLAGNIVTLTGAGTVTLQASQPAIGLYAAGTATATFQVARQAQTITFAQPSSPIPFTAAAITLTATASSGLPVSFSILSGPARVAGTTLSITGGGTIVIAADQPGNASYAPAPEVTRTVIVTFGTPTVTLSAAPNPVFLHNPVTLAATVSSPAGIPTGTVTFLDGTAPIGSAPLTAGQAAVTISTLALGPHTITAVYSGDTNFASTPSPAVIVLVQDFTLTITNPTVVIEHGGTAVYNLVVTSVGGTGLASTITLSTAGQPGYSTYSFAPAIIGAGSGTTQGTLTIHTPDFPSGPFNARLATGGTITVATLLGLLLPSRRRRRSLLATMLLALAALGTTACITGCGSGWKAQHWNVTVTATSGALTRTATATLVSQP